MQNRKPEPLAIHRRAVQHYLTQMCQAFDFQKAALGALRSRDYARLMEVVNEVDDALSAFSLTGSDGAVLAVTPSLYKQAYQFVALCKKYPYPPKLIPGVDPEGKARATLRSDERRNGRLNAIFRGYRRRGLWRKPSHATVAEVFSRVLGDYPTLTSVFQECNFTSGSNVGAGGKATHVYNKLMGKLTSTATALKYFKIAVRCNEQLAFLIGLRAGLHAPVEPLSTTFCHVVCFDYDAIDTWLEKNVEIVGYNKIDYVPKKYNTHRSIACEPVINSFLQSGMDQWMRRRLKDVLNLDLTDQTVNQVMALEGSLQGILGYATIDVKSASNGVFIELIKYLDQDRRNYVGGPHGPSAPLTWYELLNDLRSPSGMDGEYLHKYELFCSMGNGFCFPLETLIFAGIVLAATRDVGHSPDFRVYGDDIIVRCELALRVIEELESFGFRVNVEKTHVVTEFRESCGANWYSGKPVTPVFWHKAASKPRELHAIHNALSEYPDLQAQIRSELNQDGRLFCVPEGRHYQFVTDQAFRVSQDICMANRAWYSKKYQSWGYPLLSTVVVEDREVPDLFRSEVSRWAIVGGSSADKPFLLRRSTRVVTTGLPGSDSCTFDKRADIARESSPRCESKPQGARDVFTTWLTHLPFWELDLRMSFKPNLVGSDQPA